MYLHTISYDNTPNLCLYVCFCVCQLLLDHQGLSNQIWLLRLLKVLSYIGYYDGIMLPGNYLAIGYNNPFLAFKNLKHLFWVFFFNLFCQLRDITNVTLLPLKVFSCSSSELKQQIIFYFLVGVTSVLCLANLWR